MGELGIRTAPSGLGKSGIGFVIIPPNVDRYEYVEDCYRTNTVTIMGGFGYSPFPAVPCPPDILQSIQFPDQSGIMGTPVVWVLNENTASPIIFASLLNDGDQFVLGEKTYRLVRGITGKNSIEIFIDGENTGLNITMLGTSEKPAAMTVRLNSTEEDSVLEVYSDNEINLYTEKRMTLNTNESFEINVKDEGESRCKINYTKGTGFSYSDEFGNEITCVDGKVTVKSEQINHNSGKEPMVLGETLKNLLNDILTSITQLTVPTGLGPSGTPINSADFQNIASKLNTILSEKSNLE